MDDKRILVQNVESGHYEFINEDDLKKLNKGNNKWKTVSLIVFYVAAIFFFSFFFYSMYLDKYKVYLDDKEVYVEAGEKYQVVLSPKYSNNFNYSNYVYEINDTSIAEVNDHGEVQAIKNGETTLTVRFKNGLEKEQMALKVSNIEVNSLDVDDNIDIYKDDTEKVKVLINGQDNISAKLTYESSNENVFKVDGLGNITGVDTGVAILTISSINGIQTTSKVEVNTVQGTIREINIVEQDVKLYKDETQKLSLNIYPKRISSKNVKWSSSNSDVVSVDNNGNIKGLSYGTAIISVETSQGLESSTVVYVSETPEIILSDYKKEIRVGQTIQLTANIDVKWSSSDDRIAIVDANGNILGKKEGIVTINATRNNKKNNCIVYVKKSLNDMGSETKISNIDIRSLETDIDKINLDLSSINLGIGDSYKLTYSVNPENLYYNEVNWTSENPDIASVDNNGNIKALKEGVAKIKVTSVNGKESTAIINVKNSVVSAESITLNKTSERIKVGERFNLKANIIPSDTTIGTVNWSSSDESVAIVKSNGTVIAVDMGVVTIEARTNNNLIAKCELIVDPIEVSKIDINNAKDIYVYDKLRLIASINPYNATNSDIIWSSSNIDVATINQYGEITGKKAGETIITAKSSNNVTSSVKIRVMDINPFSISISENDIEMIEGESKVLKVIFSPSNTTNKNVIWSSSDPSVADIDSNGKVTAKKEGTTKISVYLNSDQTIKSEAIVKVYSKNSQPTNIILNNNNVTLYVDSTIDLKATIVPNTAINKKVKWSSSDNKIATVDSNGKVTAKKSGKVTITAMTSNSLTARSTIKVTTPLIAVKKIEIENNVVTFFVGDSINLSASVSPITASNKSVKWSSSDESIATVDSNGKVIGKKAGSVKITATSKSNPRVSGSKSIVVSIKKINVRSIALSEENINLYVEDVHKLNPILTPKDTTEKNITWSSSNSNIATVDQSGNVVAKGVGDVIVTAKAENGSTSSASIIVKNNTIKNPLRTKDGNYLYGGDPFVTYDSERGYYYYLSTSSRDVVIYASENLQDIGNPSKAVVAYKNEADSYIWAPELHHFGDNWYIYYTWTSNEKNVFARRMYVLKSKTDDPLGEYEYMGKLCDKKNDYYAIDGTVFEWGGKYYFVYSGHKNNRIKWIQNLYIMAMSNPYTVEGERHLLSEPNQLSWDNSNVNEGPEALIKNNVLYIIYSANGYRNPNYSLAMLTYNGGNILSKSGWTRNSKQVFKKGNGVYATGHASFTKSKDGTEDWIVYHAYENTKLDNRTIRIKKFTWNGNTPVFGSPDSINTPIKVPSGSTITDYTIDY